MLPHDKVLEFVIIVVFLHQLEEPLLGAAKEKMTALAMSALENGECVDKQRVLLTCDHESRNRTKIIIMREKSSLDHREPNLYKSNS